MVAEEARVAGGGRDGRQRWERFAFDRALWAHSLTNWVGDRIAASRTGAWNAGPR